MGSIASQGRLVQIPLDQVKRNDGQPRTNFDADAIEALAESVAARGVIQPIAVREVQPGEFEIIAGERRWLAARRAGLATIPAVVHDVPDHDAMVMAVVENVVREDLGSIELARAYASLVDEHGVSASEIASAVGRSRSAVANTLRLLELPDDVIALLERGALSEGHGRALLQVKDRSWQRRLALHAVECSMSVRALEALARQRVLEGGTTGASSQPTPHPQPAPELEDVLQRLQDACGGAIVRAKLGGRAPRVEIRFSDVTSLCEGIESLVAQLPAR